MTPHHDTVDQIRSTHAPGSLLIGLSGKMQTGKSTTANYLAHELGGAVVSFADALRDEVAYHFGLDRLLLRNSRYKGLSLMMGMRGMTVREILQWFGALRREQNPDYWIERTLATRPPGIVIIDDVRYQNEAEAIRAAGGYVFRLEPYPDWHPGVGADHVSETDLDGWTFDAVYRPRFGKLEETAMDIARRV